VWGQFLEDVIICLVELKVNKARETEARRPPGAMAAAWAVLCVIWFFIIVYGFMSWNLRKNGQVEPMREWEIKRKHGIEQLDQRLRRTPASP
jgi:hypothetical protein